MMFCDQEMASYFNFPLRSLLETTVWETLSTCHAGMLDGVENTEEWNVAAVIPLKSTGQFQPEAQKYEEGYKIYK